MLAINGLKCVYDTGSRGWAIELALAGDETARRFDVDGPEDAEMLIEAFEDSSTSHFDPATGEIIFAYEYLDGDDEEDEDEDGETEASADEDTDEDEDEDDAEVEADDAAETGIDDAKKDKA